MFILEVNLPMPTLPALPNVSSGNGSGAGTGGSTTPRSGTDAFMSSARTNPFGTAASSAGIVSAYSSASLMYGFSQRATTLSTLQTSLTTLQTDFATRCAAAPQPMAYSLTAGNAFATSAEGVAMQQQITTLQTTTIPNAQTAANCRTPWGYGRATGWQGGLLGGLGRILSIVGAVLALKEHADDGFEIEEQAYQQTLAGSQILIAANSSDERVQQAAAQGDHVRLAALLGGDSASSEVRGLIGRVQAAHARKKDAEHNSSVSFWGIMAGCALGALLVCTGPIGLLATPAAFCSGICLANLGSKFFRQTTPIPEPGLATGYAYA